MRMTESEALRVARRHLQELSYWAATSPGEKSLGYHGAVARAKALVETPADQPPAKLGSVAVALCDLVLWTRIGLAPPSRTLGCMADRVERFLTVELGQAPSAGGEIASEVTLICSENGDQAAGVEVEERMVVGRGATELAALGTLAETLAMKLLRIEAALRQVRAMQAEAQALAPRRIPSRARRCTPPVPRSRGACSTTTATCRSRRRTCATTTGWRSTWPCPRRARHPAAAERDAVRGLCHEDERERGGVNDAKSREIDAHNWSAIDRNYRNHVD